MKATLIRNLFLAIIACSVLANVHAQQADQGASPPTEAGAAGQENWQHLETLVSTINAKRKELSELRRQLITSQEEFERDRLEKEINQAELDLESLQTAWEMLATGGADLSLFGVKTEAAFNWRTELQSVFEPWS